MTLALERELYQRLRIRAMDEGRPRSRIIREAIDAYLANVSREGVRVVVTERKRKSQRKAKHGSKKESARKEADEG